MRKKRSNHLPSRELARIISQAAADVKAVQLEVLDLRKYSAFTDYFVIASGHSDRQVQAICDRIQQNLEKKERRPIGLEGYSKGHWVLLDYGDVVAHVFYEEMRPIYSLEQLWSEAPRVRFRLK